MAILSAIAQGLGKAAGFAFHGTEALLVFQQALIQIDVENERTLEVLEVPVERVVEVPYPVEVCAFFGVGVDPHQSCLGAGQTCPSQVALFPTWSRPQPRSSCSLHCSPTVGFGNQIHMRG